MENILPAYKLVSERRYRETPGLYWEDFEPDDVFEHRSGRTVLDVDNTYFTLLTLNVQELHFDAAYAAKTEWKKPLVDSTFTLALLTGMRVRTVSAKVVAQLLKQPSRPAVPFWLSLLIDPRCLVIGARTIRPTSSEQLLAYAEEYLMTTKITENYVGKIFKELEHGDGAGFFEHVDDKVDWIVEGTHPLAGHYKSKSDFLAGTFAKLAKVLPNGAQLVVEHLLMKDDQAVVELHSLAMAKNGLRFDNRYCWVVHFHDDTIDRVRAYLDSAMVARLFEENPI
jgi:uncharacterized protein